MSCFRIFDGTFVPYSYEGTYEFTEKENLFWKTFTDQTRGDVHFLRDVFKRPCFYGSLKIILRLENPSKAFCDCLSCALVDLMERTGKSPETLELVSYILRTQGTFEKFPTLYCYAVLRICCKETTHKEDVEVLIRSLELPNRIVRKQAAYTLMHIFKLKSAEIKGVNNLVLPKVLRNLAVTTIEEPHTAHILLSLSTTCFGLPIELNKNAVTAVVCIAMRTLMNFYLIEYEERLGDYNPDAGSRETITLKVLRLLYFVGRRFPHLFKLQVEDMRHLAVVLEWWETSSSEKVVCYLVFLLRKGCVDNPKFYNRECLFELLNKVSVSFPASKAIDQVLRSFVPKLSTAEINFEEDQGEAKRPRLEEASI
jgi:hypothetical protein